MRLCCTADVATEHSPFFENLSGLSSRAPGGVLRLGTMSLWRYEGTTAV